MQRTLTAVVWLATLLAFAAHAVAQARDVSAVASAKADLDVRASVDKTAMWVGDRITYTITIVCHKGVDILPDDLAKDKLHADGFEILSSRSDRTAGRDEATTYTFAYDLTTYRVDMPELKIAPSTVRYFVRRAGQRLEDAAPAGEVQVPGSVVAVRSALPDGQETYELRDARDPQPRRLRYAWLQPVGIALVLISIVPAAIAAIAAIHRVRPRAKPRSARQVRYDERAALEALQTLDLSTAEGRREAYSQVNALVRDHLRYVAGVDTAGRTPSEINAVLAGRDGRVPVDAVTSILDACDHARYAPPEAAPSAEACRRAIEQCEQVLRT